MPDHRSPEAQVYRAWYKTRAWQILRQSQLTAQPLCRMCDSQGYVTAASVVDHIKAHKGDRIAFFDPSNLQSLCKPCHDRHAQRRDRTGREAPAIGLDGWPVGDP